MYTGELPRWQQRPEKVVPEWSLPSALCQKGEEEWSHFTEERELKCRVAGTCSHHSEIFTLTSCFRKRGDEAERGDTSRERP